MLTKDSSVEVIVPDKMSVAQYFLTRLNIPIMTNTNGRVVMVEPDEATRLVCERFSTYLRGNCSCVLMSIKNTLRAPASDWPIDSKTGQLASQNAVFMNSESPGHPYANFIHKVVEMWGDKFVSDRNNKECIMGNNCTKKKK